MRAEPASVPVGKTSTRAGVMLLRRSEDGTEPFLCEAAGDAGDAGTQGVAAPRRGDDTVKGEDVSEPAGAAAAEDGVASRFGVSLRCAG